MGAPAPVSELCPNCGAGLPRDARFCAACGAPLEEEPAPAPVSYDIAEPHWFGVTPPNLLLGVAAATLVVAVALFATGHWPFGLIVLGLAALLLAAFLEAARRRPESRFTRASTDARERAHSRWEAFRVRQAAAVEVRRVQGRLLYVESERRARLQELGAAAHAGDSTAEAAARARLSELDEQETALREELERALDDAGERIRRARLPVEETMMVLPTEPYPPPDEGTPPEPAIVPEPYPPPDEGNPPTPAPDPDSDQ
jgi:zinc-ribbon domain